MENYTTSANRKMDYYDKIDIHKDAFSGRELFESLLTLVMEVVQDTELSEMDAKDLLIAIAEEM